jgi:hypothetical protein
VAQRVKSDSIEKELVKSEQFSLEMNCLNLRATSFFDELKMKFIFLCLKIQPLMPVWADRKPKARQAPKNRPDGLYYCANISA